MPIVDISAMTVSDSRNISLVATTQYGMRLYFSISQFEQSTSAQLGSGVLNPNTFLAQQHQSVLGMASLTGQQTGSGITPVQYQAPSTFQLVHVRIPPNIELQQQQQQQQLQGAQRQGNSIL
jgi:hypothetical protein